MSELFIILSALSVAVAAVACQVRSVIWALSTAGVFWAAITVLFWLALDFFVSAVVTLK